MREKMFTDRTFEAAVFIGGMKGIEDQFHMFGRNQPMARRIPVLSTGGATSLIEAEAGEALSAEEVERLRSDVDFLPLFHDLCGIDPREPRGGDSESDARWSVIRFRGKGCKVIPREHPIGVVLSLKFIVRNYDIAARVYYANSHCQVVDGVDEAASRAGELLRGSSKVERFGHVRQDGRNESPLVCG